MHYPLWKASTVCKTKTSKAMVPLSTLSTPVQHRRCTSTRISMAYYSLPLTQTTVRQIRRRCPLTPLPTTHPLQSSTFPTVRPTPSSTPHPLYRMHRRVPFRALSHAHSLMPWHLLHAPARIHQCNLCRNRERHRRSSPVRGHPTRRLSTLVRQHQVLHLSTLLGNHAGLHVGMPFSLPICLSNVLV